MDKDDNFTRIGSSGNQVNEEDESYYSDELGGDSDIDYDEFEAKYYSEFEQTHRAQADINTIKENQKGIKKVIFQKGSEVQKKYDPKLVLKEFIKEQHRPLVRLDLFSNKEQFFEHTTGRYNLESMLGYIKENSKLAAQKQTVFNSKHIKEHDEVQEGQVEFTCLATKLDEYIKRVNEKYFMEIFQNSCNLDKKKWTHIYDIIDWQLKEKNLEQVKKHQTNNLMKSIKKGMLASIQEQVENQGNIKTNRKPQKRVGLIKMLAAKFNIKTKTIRMDVIQSNGQFFLIQTNNTQGQLYIIIYNIVDDQIDWENQIKHILSRNVSSTFDVTSKMFKEHDNKLYYWYVDEKESILRNVCLKTHILKSVLKMPVINIQAIIWCHDEKCTHKPSEEDWLKIQNYGVITQDNNFDFRDHELKSYFPPAKIFSNKFENNHLFLFLVQQESVSKSFTKSNCGYLYVIVDEQKPVIYHNKTLMKENHHPPVLLLKSKSLFDNMDHQVFINMGTHKHLQIPLLKEKTLALQENIFQKKIEDDSLNQQFVVHAIEQKKSYLINCDLASVEMIVLNYKVQNQDYIKSMCYLSKFNNNSESPYETMLRGVRQRGVIAIQVSSQFNNIFMTPNRDRIMEVGYDEFGKNKINDYKLAEIEGTEKNVQYVYPFYHIFEDLNIPNVNDTVTSLHNFHMNINQNMMAYNWPQFGTKSFFPKNYLQLAKSKKVTYHKRGRYMRNFQVCQRFVANDQKYQWFNIKEFQFCVKGKNPMIAQIGQKLVILNFNCNAEMEFVPLYKEHTSCIIGTQFIIKHMANKKGHSKNEDKIKRIPLENFKQLDYQFRSKLANSGYQRICLDGIDEDVILIIDCKLNKAITDIQRKGFQLDYNERDLVIKSQLKNVLNMIPIMNVFSLTQNGPRKEDRFDFFQPQEYLKGKCRANYFSRNEKMIYQQIQKITEIDPAKKIDTSQLYDSLIQQFIKNSIKQENGEHELSQQELSNQMKESSLLESLGEMGWIRQPFEIMNDLNHQNVIEDALNFEKNELAFKMLFDFAYKQTKSKETYDTFSRVLYLAFNEKVTFTDCLVKFINDNGDVRGNFSIALPLENQDLPKFSKEEHSLAEYDINNAEQELDPAIYDEEKIKQQFHLNQEKDQAMLMSFGAYPSDYNKVEFLGIHKQFNNEFSPLGIIPVQHFIIDFRSILLNEKLMILKGKRDANTTVQFTEFDFAKLIYNINKKFTNSIEDQNCIRALIDFQFDRTQAFYHRLFMSYIVFHMIPFVAQLLFISDPFYVRCCLISCTLRQVLSLLIESIQIKMIGRKYFLESQQYGRFKVGIPKYDNIVKLIMLILFFVYMFFEFRTPYTTLGERGAFTNETLKHGLTDYDMMMNILICFNIAQIVLQTNYFMQVYQSFGLLRQLIIICLKDMVPFTIYMTMFLLMFAILYKILGVSIGNSNYPGMNDFGMFFMNTFENSIGNVSNPDVKIWTNSDNISQLETTLIYSVWLSNQFMTTIVLMNFLIAVISQSYENVMNKLHVHTYKNRSSMNFQYYQIMEFYQQSKKLTLVLLQSKTAGAESEGGDGDEWTGFVQTLKSFLKLKLSPMENKLNEVITTMDTLHSEVETVKNNLHQIENGQDIIAQEIKQMIKDVQAKNELK